MSDEHRDGQDTPKPDGSQPTERQTRLALSYLLLGLGIPIAGAFLYPFLPGRRGAESLWSHMDGSPRALSVLLIGGAVGVAMTVAGFMLQNSDSVPRRRRRRRTR